MNATVTYTPRYNFTCWGLERLHPFDGRKYAKAWAILKARFGRRLDRSRLRPLAPCPPAELRAVHTDDYLSRDLRSPAYLARALEIPQLARAPHWLIDWRVLTPMRWAVAGTVLAARAALDRGVAVNLGGGFHHASADRGEGFSVYADAAIAIASLRNSGALTADDRVAYIDLDAHQGNGVARIFGRDASVFIFDIYNQDIYPLDLLARRRIDCDLPVMSGCEDARYLATLRSELPRFLDSISSSRLPRLAVYNAGTDILDGDPLGRMRVSAEGVLERDRFVLRQLAERRIPSLMLPSGGYTLESHRLVAATIGWIVDSRGGAASNSR